MKTEIKRQRQSKPEVSPAAVDEIFAGLARRALDPRPLRELADDLDRQHERLSQLLRDLESSDTSD